MLLVVLFLLLFLLLHAILFRLSVYVFGFIAVLLVAVVAAAGDDGSGAGAMVICSLCLSCMFVRSFICLLW